MPKKTKSRAARPKQQSPQVNARFNIVAALVLLVSIGAGFAVSAAQKSPHGIIVGIVVGLILMQSPRIARQWERAVVLRLGKYDGLRGPGLFWIIPFIDTVSSWIDQRVITTNFNAEETLTSDTVPVNVDAVLFWMVYDPEKAALEVQDYARAVSWAAQTALRDIIGRTSLSELLRGREQIEADLQKLIDERCTPWGVTVQSVEMRDVIIPASLQDAMSREAQASREKAGPHHSRPGGSGDRPSVPAGVELVSRQSDRAAPARDEHPVRRPEGERRADARAEHRRRVHGTRRHARGRRRAAD